MTDAEVEKAMAACLVLLRRWIGAGLRDLETGLDRVQQAADTVRDAFLRLVTEGQLGGTQGGSP